MLSGTVILIAKRFRDASDRSATRAFDDAHGVGSNSWRRALMDFRQRAAAVSDFRLRVISNDDHRQEIGIVSAVGPANPKSPNGPRTYRM